MKQIFPWLLWLWNSAVIWAAFYYAPISVGFAGLDGASPQSSRIVFFHVPMAVASFVAFLVAAWHAAVYLRKRTPAADRASSAAVEIGLVFCVLATVTGAVWAEVQWGDFWNWDPRQTSIAIAIVFYGAYLTLRSTLEDPEIRARISAAYCALGFFVAPFLFFIMPRMASFSLHPKPASAEMDWNILVVVLGGIIGYSALFFWMHRLRCRLLVIEERRTASYDDDLEPIVPSENVASGSLEGASS